MRMIRPGDAERSIILLAGVFLCAVLSGCGPGRRAEMTGDKTSLSSDLAAVSKTADISAVHVSDESGPPASAPCSDAPFDIQVVRAAVVDAGAEPAEETAASAGGETAADAGMPDPDHPPRQLQLVVEINNRTDQTFEQVRCSLRLNTEPEPFDVNSLLAHGSEGVFRVVPRQADVPDGPDGGVMVVRGFVRRWTIDLPSSEDSAEEHERALANLPDTVRSVTVDIDWDGGSQSETIPVHVQRS